MSAVYMYISQFIRIMSIVPPCTSSNLVQNHQCYIYYNVYVCTYMCALMICVARCMCACALSCRSTLHVADAGWCNL